MVRISIIGSGVVGTATGKGLHEIGHELCFYDSSSLRLGTLEEEGYRTTHNIADALSNAEVCFICVNTPSTEKKGDNTRPDLSQITAVLYDLVIALNQLRNKKSGQSGHGIAKQRRKTSFHNQAGIKDEPTDGSKPPLLVFRSTLLPGTMRNLVMKYLATHCSLRMGRDFRVVYNPEFLRQKFALYDFLNPDRVVIGEDDISSGSGSSSTVLKQLYDPLTKNIIVTDYETAELIKYAANCFLSMKISYFNEIGIICKRLGLNADIVNHAVSLDKRIGSFGIQAGRPYGGRCLPKDAKAFAAFVQEILSLDVRSDLLRATIEINNMVAQEEVQADCLRSTNKIV